MKVGFVLIRKNASLFLVKELPREKQLDHSFEDVFVGNHYLFFNWACSFIKEERIFFFILIKFFKSIHARVSTWELKFLSMADKLLLVKSVLYSMLIYLCQTIFPTLEVCKKLDKLFNRFFWGFLKVLKKFI